MYTPRVGSASDLFFIIGVGCLHSPAVRSNLAGLVISLRAHTHTRHHYIKRVEVVWVEQGDKIITPRNVTK